MLVIGLGYTYFPGIAIGDREPGFYPGDSLSEDPPWGTTAMFHDTQTSPVGVPASRVQDGDFSAPIVRIWLETRQRQQDLIDEAMQVALRG